jgi:Fis family transcriptional regulator
VSSLQLKSSAKSKAVTGSLLQSARESSSETVEQCVLRSLEQYFAELDGAPPHALYELVTGAVERPLLQFAMQRTDGNQSAAAALLGINRNTLRKKLAHYSMLNVEQR